VREALWAATARARDLGLPVKWVRGEGVHLTLKFLGDVADEREPELAAALTRAAAGARGLALALGGFGVFPDFRRPRVVWVGIAPEPGLEILQHRVEQEFAPLGFPTEARAFRPHVTLGRTSRDARPAALTGLEEALGRLEFAETALVRAQELRLVAGRAVGRVAGRSLPARHAGDSAGCARPDRRLPEPARAAADRWSAAHRAARAGPLHGPGAEPAGHPVPPAGGEAAGAARG